MKRWVIILVCLILLYNYLEKNHGKWYYPAKGIASWYDPHHTSAGETYREGELTCAMRKTGFGKYYLVCNQENNKCVEVRHNDFGPAFPLFVSGRIIDLSREAFSKIADLEKGLVRVRVGEVSSGQVD